VGWVGLGQKGANSQAGVYPGVGERSRVRVPTLVLKNAEDAVYRVSLVRAWGRWRKGGGRSPGIPSAGDSAPLPVPRWAGGPGSRDRELLRGLLRVPATVERRLQPGNVPMPSLGQGETRPRAEVYTNRPRGVGGLGWRITNPALPRIRTSSSSPRPSRRIPGPGPFLPPTQPQEVSPRKDNGLESRPRGVGHENGR